MKRTARHVLSHSTPLLKEKQSLGAIALPLDRLNPLRIHRSRSRPRFSTLEESLPVTFDSDGIHLKPERSYFSGLKHALWLMLNHRQGEQQPSNDDIVPSAIIEGIESPYQPGRSIVLVALRDDRSEDEFTTAFFERSQSSDIAHSVSLLRGTQFTSYAVGTSDYRIGNISKYAEIRIWLAGYFWLMLPAVSLSSLILGKWMHEYLLRRAAVRLRFVQ